MLRVSGTSELAYNPSKIGFLWVAFLKPRGKLKPSSTTRNATICFVTEKPILLLFTAMNLLRMLTDWQTLSSTRVPSTTLIDITL